MILTGHKLPALNIDYVLLTPELAAEWLARNQDNRREKFVKQAAYIRDMREGRWLQTGETFKFEIESNEVFIASKAGRNIRTTEFQREEIGALALHEVVGVALLETAVGGY